MMEETIQDVHDHLDEIKEKLNLSRFDTTVLLSIPIVLFLITATATWLPSFLSSTFGVSPYVGPIIMGFVVFPISLGILQYASAYFKDNLGRRLIALDGYLLGIWFTIPLLFGYPLKILLELYEKHIPSSLYLNAAAWLFSFGCFLALHYLAAILVSSRFWNGVDGWLKANVPRKYGEFRDKDMELTGILTFAHYFSVQANVSYVTRIKKFTLSMLAGLLAFTSIAFVQACRSSCGDDITTLLVALVAIATAMLAFLPLRSANRHASNGSTRKDPADATVKRGMSE